MGMNTNTATVYTNTDLYEGSAAWDAHLAQLVAKAVDAPIDSTILVAAYAVSWLGLVTRQVVVTFVAVSNLDA